MTSQPSAFAFFDVDETLIAIKSMFDFYDYFLEAVGHSEQEQSRLRSEARALLRPGLPRKEGNRLFYRRFADYRVREVAEIGQHWFDDHLARGRFFHTDVCEALRRHRDRGRTTVLLSGSFPACLDPIAAHLGADLALSTVLETRDASYTGEVLQTMIGDAKADSARDMLNAASVDPSVCYAYGDHTSDLGLLELVGHPVVVGGNPQMNAVADRNAWGRLVGAV